MATRSTFIKEFIKKFYYKIRNSSFVYVNIVNSQQKKEFASLKLDFNSTQQLVLRDLNLSGISVINIEELFDINVLNEMTEWISKNEKNLKIKAKKKFLQSYFGTEDSELLLDLTNPFVKFYTSDEILKIVTAYLGYIPQLFEIYVEKTTPVGEESASYSQNWHRDPEEKRTLKVFIYLSDVTLEAGPFTYLVGSTPTGRGRYRKLFPQKLPHGSYPSESSVLGKIDPDDLLVVSGVQGSVIFCDTSGLHRGGYAKSQHRIMSTGFYPSKNYSESPRFSVKGLENVSGIDLQPLARKVLGIENVKR